MSSVKELWNYRENKLKECKKMYSEIKKLIERNYTKLSSSQLDYIKVVNNGIDLLHTKTTSYLEKLKNKEELDSIEKQEVDETDNLNSMINDLKPVFLYNLLKKSEMDEV